MDNQVIGKTTRQAIMDSITTLLIDYEERIDAAYKKVTPLSISFKIKINPTPEGKHDIITGINFVAEKCQDEIRIQVAE